MVWLYGKRKGERGIYKKEVKIDLEARRDEDDLKEGEKMVHKYYAPSSLHNGNPISLPVKHVLPFTCGLVWS